MEHQAAILTISDKASRGEREDIAGAQLKAALQAHGIEVVHTATVPDEPDQIAAALKGYADEMCLALVLTTGGTGLSPRDITPEATKSVMEREVPGMAEAMRQKGLSHTPHAMLSRGMCVIRKATLIVNLPGSPKGSLEGLETILSALAHALDKLRGDSRDCAR